MTTPRPNWPPTFFLTETDHPLRPEIGTALAACGWEPVSQSHHASLTIDLAERPLVPEEAGLPVAAFRGLSIHRRENRLRLGYRDWSACLDTTADRLRVAGPPVRDGDDRILFQDVFIRETILLWLRRRNVFELHAAACGRRNEGILFVGQSGSGKTTATLALIEAGWSYVSDDAVVLRGDANLVAHPLRRTFSLKPDLFARRPDLHFAIGGDVLGTGKRRLDPNRVWPDRRMDSLTPTRLVFCEISPGDASEIRRISQSDAFGRLLSGSPWAVLDRETAPRHIDSYRRLTVQCDSHVFSAGRDVLHEPSRLAILLATNQPR